MPDKIIQPLDADFDELASAIVSSAGPKDINAFDQAGVLQKDFLFYSDGESKDRIRVFISGEDTWVTQAALSEIFDVSRSTISEHLTNIYASGELSKDATVRKIRIVQKEGRRNVSRELDHYNLDVILSIGYKVNSRKAVQFRIWSNKVLKEYLIKGFAMDDDRLKQGNQLFSKDYFDELLERIREIRASERRFYQKVTQIYISCSHDYDPKSELTKKFFSHAQNKLEYAVTGMTAAEIIKLRANHNLPNMGLTTWKTQKDGGKVRKSDVSTAKNYLAESEISDLNRLVTMFLDFAENLAKKGRQMSMKDWHEKLDDFLKFNEFEILRDYGSVKGRSAKRISEAEFEKFKPIQNENYKSDFDKIVEDVKSKGSKA